MNAHQHHEHRGRALHMAAQKQLESHGEQWTDMRANIFDILARFGKPASAYDIADMVSKKREKRVAPNSIYRILDLFVKTNLARRVESANAYIANTHPGCEHDCIFLICEQCGETVHIDDDELTNHVRQRAETTGYSVIQPVIEVRGTCGNCTAP